MELNAKIIYYKDILSDSKKILQVVKQELGEVSAKYGDRRRTEITLEELGGMNIEDFIKEEDVVVLISNKGFVKRVPPDEYRSQGRGGKGVRGATLRDDDFVEHLFLASTHDYVMVVTNRGKAIAEVHEIPAGSKTSKGRASRSCFLSKKARRLPHSSTSKSSTSISILLWLQDLGLLRRATYPSLEMRRPEGSPPSSSMREMSCSTVSW
jgi:DNA gyrase subunit A